MMPRSPDGERSRSSAARRCFRKGGCSLSWVYEARLYDSRSVANYVAMCVRDDQILRGCHQPLVQIYRTRKGNYGVRYTNELA